MVTCPYCGTSYVSFQSNCSKCGGPLPPPPDPDTPRSPDTLTPAPPLPPRSISGRYVWKLLWGDGWAIASLVFVIVAIAFFGWGIFTAFMMDTIFIGVLFVLIGLLFFFAGLGIFAARYQLKSEVVEVLRNGQAVQGVIESVTVNHSVRINRVHPWTISYRFTIQGTEHHGKVTTITPPGESLREGMPAWVLYLPEEPEDNAIYPHP